MHALSVVVGMLSTDVAETSATRVLTMRAHELVHHALVMRRPPLFVEEDRGQTSNRSSASCQWSLD